MYLRIAAIALSRDMVVLTRNLSDFPLSTNLHRIMAVLN